MTNVSSWVLSIVCVCFISIIIDLILPEGKINKNVKKAVSYSIIIMIIMPMVSFLNGSKTLDIFSSTNIYVQEDYIYNLNQSKITQLTNDIESEISKKGIIGTEVSISADIFSNPMEINAVYVDLYNAVISNNNKNINIQTEVLNVILNLVNISKEQVIFYE